MEDTVTTNVIKRNGEEVHFDRAKIVNAITKANGNVERIHQMNPYQIEAIADTIAEQVQEMPHAVNVEDIQDMVETSIMEMRGYEVAQKYVRYRYRRELKRKSNTTDNGILALLDHINEEVNQENSNKNPVIRVISWYWIVWMPLLTSSRRRRSVTRLMISSSSASPHSVRSAITFLRSF